MISPKTIRFHAYRDTSADRLTIFKGGPVKFVAVLDPSIDLTGCTSIRLDIRESVTDVNSPLATSEITTGLTAREFEFEFSSGETNQSVSTAWLVISAYFPADDNLDPIYISELFFVPHNASLLAPSPPDAAVAITQSYADNRYLLNSGNQSGILIGRYSSGTGVLQTITLGANLSLTSGGILSAGAGGSVSWGAIVGTITDQSDLLVFKNISVPGQSNIVANNAAATLTITGMGGISLFTDASSDTLIISGGAGGSYTDEQAQDAIGGILQNGTGLALIYNDINGYISGNVSLSPFSTTNLNEGNNLYYTDERVDDRVSTLIKNGTGVIWTYNDTAGTLSGDISLSQFSTTNLSEGINLYYTDERAQDYIGNNLRNGTGFVFTYNDASGYISGDVSLSSFSTTNLSEGSNLYYTDERVRDTIGASLRNGTGFIFTYSDVSDYISGDISLTSFSTSNLSEGSNLYYTDERVDDRVSNLVKNGTGIVWTYNDTNGTLSGDVGIGITVQGWDAALDAFAAYNTNGLIAQISANTFTGRTITGTANEITVINGNGIDGNPIVSIPSWLNLSSKTGLSIPSSAAPLVDTNGQIALDTTVTNWSHGLIKYYGGEELGIVSMPISQFTSPSNNYVVKYNSAAQEFQLAIDLSTTGDGGTVGWGSITGTITNQSDLISYFQPLDSDLTSIAGFNGSGFLTRTGENFYTGRSFQGTSNQINVLYGDGIGGNPTISLASGIDASYIGNGSVSTTEFHYLGNVTSDIQTQFNNRISRQIFNPTGSLTMGSASGVDYVYFVTGNYTMSLPTSTGNYNKYTVKNLYTGVNTIDTTGPETLEGANSINLIYEASVDIISNQFNWYIV